MDTEKQESEDGKKELEEGVRLLKLANRQYAKRQIKWIRNRFIRKINRQVSSNVYEFRT